jgi:cellulose synthase/poly-beta-1,6-N-acetylglucosamine synthase-like glycosyltransferase
METLFWLSVGFVAYVYLGYPVLLAGLSALLRHHSRREPIEPTVSVVVPAYNEASVIQAKIRNVLTQDYPADRLELVIASDGSTDGTARLAKELADDARVRVFDFRENRGKVTALNDVIPQVRGEIVAFSDAASMLAPDAIRRLVASFADPGVGAVSGVYRVRSTEASTIGTQEDFYWRYETFLKTREAEAGGLLGAHGSLYAIRKDLYPYPPADTINDDYIIPVRVVQRGFKVAYEPKAVAYEEAHEMEGFSRRVRIMAGNIQQFREIMPLLKPLRPLHVFFFISHKAGRVAVPFFMILALIANSALLGRPTYLALGTLQAAFYGVAAIGSLRPLQPRVLRLPYYLCIINVAALIAIVRLALPGRRLVWNRRRERAVCASP